MTCDALCLRRQAGSAPTETPQEEVPEAAADNDSEQVPEDENPEEEDEDEDDDEEDEPYEEEYRVSPPRFFNTPVLDGFSGLFLMSHRRCVFDKQSPPTKQTPEKKDDDDDEGTMPPYDPETQELIDGMCA